MSKLTAPLLLLLSIALAGANCDGGAVPGDDADSPNDDGCICAEVWDPVCGDDGVTYGNECEAACVDATVMASGECGDLPSCDDVSCDPGSHCELTEVWCVNAPCPPQPECIADDLEKSDEWTPCGSNSCRSDEVCCNASCGICVPEGVFCTQQACTGAD